MTTIQQGDLSSPILDLSENKTNAVQSNFQFAFDNFLSLPESHPLV